MFQKTWTRMGAKRDPVKEYTKLLANPKTKVVAKKSANAIPCKCKDVTRIGTWRKTKNNADINAA